MVEGRRAAGGPRRGHRSARCRAARATRRASRNASANGSASMWTAIKLIQGDTDIVPVGGGSHSARSMRMGGVVMGKASEAVIQKATKIAGHVLETDPADVAFAEGRFTVKGTDRSIGLFEVARAARERNDLPDDLRGPLAAECDEFIRGARLPVRLRGLRGRDRPRHRPCRDRALHRDRRRRPRHQSADPARPDPRRHRPGRRPGAVGAFALRSATAGSCWPAR